MLTLAVKAARRAANLLLRYQERLEQVEVERKGRNDFASEVDRIVEADLIDTIHYRYPNHCILAEESGSRLSPPAASADTEYEWLLDPLDGSANYLRGHCHFCVSIAVRYKGELAHGVVLDPLREELYTASRGQGAQLNDRRIRASQQRRLAHALLASGFTFRQPEQLEHCLRLFKAMLLRASDVHNSGSAALDLAYVAAGRLDGYWQEHLHAWDVAAGALLVREAGGLVSDFAGEQDFLDNGRIIAANPALFNQLLLLTRRYAQPDTVTNPVADSAADSAADPTADPAAVPDPAARPVLSSA